MNLLSYFLKVYLLPAIMCIFYDCMIVMDARSFISLSGESYRRTETVLYNLRFV